MFTEFCSEWLTPYGYLLMISSSYPRIFSVTMLFNSGSFYFINSFAISSVVYFIFVKSSCVL